MRTLISILLAIGLSAAACGCGARDAAYDPSHFRFDGVLSPPDVILPPHTSGGADVGGLYTISGIEGNTCCLIAPQARLRVRKFGVAARLRVNLYVPNTAFFVTHPQRLTVKFPKAKFSYTSAYLRPGFRTVMVKLPPALRDVRGSVLIALDFVDARDFNLVLTSIYFE